MKMNKKHMHAAILHTAIEYSSIKELANETSDILGSTEVHNIKANGFVLRLRKDNDLDYDELTESITSAVISILNANLEEASDYILENYEFAYNPDAVIDSYMRELFDYTRDGRLIYVEIDE